MEIIPAIDIIEGKCVRLRQGDFARKKIYNENPLDVAREFEDAGLGRLHLVDLDGARTGSVKNWKVLELIAGKTRLVIDFGGGINTVKDVQVVLDSGAAMAAVGSIAIKDESAFFDWLARFGNERFFLGADVKDEMIMISGWQDCTQVGIYDFIEKYMAKGIRQVFCTDIRNDGTLEGPSIELYKQVLTRFPGLHLVASGGVSSLKDLEQLRTVGCSAVIIGKAIYENRISLKELFTFNNR